MITTDGYREKSSDTIIFMCIIEKVTAIGRVTAIGYRPAIGCDMYIVKKKESHLAMIGGSASILERH